MPHNFHLYLIYETFQVNQVKIWNGPDHKPNTFDHPNTRHVSLHFFVLFFRWVNIGKERDGMKPDAVQVTFYNGFKKIKIQIYIF